MTRRTFDERTADTAVLGALRARKGVATRADLIVATALPEQTVERALHRLLDRYASSVGVAEGGTLVYRFDPRFRVRPERRPLLRAFLTGLGRVVRAVATFARATFRAVLALQLIVYTFLILVPVSVVVGVVVGVVFLVMLIFSDNGGSVIELLFNEYVLAIVLGGCVLAGIAVVFKVKYDLLLQLVGVKQLDVGERGVGGLVARVSGFALGPPDRVPRRERTDRTWRISLADERRVLARIRRQGGRLRAGDLVAWLGLDLDTADSQATRLCVEYGGEPTPLPMRLDRADDLETLEFHFPSLMQTAGDGDGKLAEQPTRFERQPPPPAFTGNQRRHDAMVLGYAAFNLIAGLIGWHFLGERRHTGAWWWLAWVGGAVLPVTFSGLLVALPVLRAPIFTLRRAWALARVARARMLTAIVDRVRQRGARTIDLARLGRGLPPDARLPAPSSAELRAVAVALGGTFDLDDVDAPEKTVWRFPRLAAELRPVRRDRALEQVAAGTAEGDGGHDEDGAGA